MVGSNRFDPFSALGTGAGGISQGPCSRTAPRGSDERRAVILSVSALLLGISVLLVGSGLLGTLLGVRAALESFPAVVIGPVMSAYFLGFVVGTYLCPPVIRRVGHIRAFAAMAGLAAASAFAHVLYVSPWAWGFLRAVTGVCQVGLYMVVESWLNERAPAESRGRVFAVYIASILAAGALGQALVPVDGAAGALGFGLAAVLFALGLVPVALTDLAEPVPVTAQRAGLGRLVRASPLGVVGTLVSGLANSAFWGMGAVFALRVGMSTGEIAAFMAATISGGAVLQWPIGYLSDRFERRAVLIAVCLAGAGVALGLRAAVDVSHPVLLAGAFAYGGLAFSVYSLSVAHLNDHLAPGEVLEATRGLLLVYGVGATLGPSVAGLLMGAFGPGSLLLYFAAAYGALGLFALLRAQMRPPVPAEDQRPFVPLARMSPVGLELNLTPQGGDEAAEAAPGPAG
ncbi:MAG: MFS transporter [Deferrisomatales bacterium]|nr:MFS transporter [Deferrisomatales bacterium]